MMIRYKGDTRTGYVAGHCTLPRVTVPSGSIGRIVQKSNAGILVEFKIDGRWIRFHAPRWQLRKLVKK